jgi:predicted nucleic acid-binding protein
VDAFVDTNVLLDVLARRQPFYADAFRIWTLAEEGQIRGIVSAISFSNLFYIICKQSGPGEARRAMRLLRDTFGPAPVDDPLLHQAIDSGFEDLEDGIQFFSALRSGAACLVTRNPGHFPTNEIPVLTPTEFLATYFPE